MWGKPEWYSYGSKTNILPLGLYNVLIDMDWLEHHHVMLDCLHKSILFIDSQRNQVKVQGIPKKVSIREISTLQAKKCIRKRLQVVCSKHPRHRVLKGTTHRRISHSWTIQECVSWGNPKIASEMRPRLFHRTDTRISYDFQIPLPHECTKISGTQTAVARVDREMV